MGNWPAELLRLAVPIALLAVVIGWGFFYKTRRSPSQVGDDEPGTPYRIYATEFDAELRANEAVAFVLKRNEGKPDGAAATLGGWSDRIIERDRIFDALTAEWNADCAELLGTLEQWTKSVSVLLLLDQSGSMSDRIIGYGAALRWVHQRLVALDVPVMLAGFTTSEWRGGLPRQQWLAEGRSFRPGRLCPLLYIRYSDFDRAPAEEDWDAMMHPSMLRENVDGEALRWAAKMLESQGGSKRALVLLSDGAPVDDSTLMENGPHYLERDLLAAIADLGQQSGPHLHAIGLDYAVDRYYPNSSHVDDPKKLPAAILRAIAAAVEIADLVA